jgi:hypothetical protein
LSFLRIHFKTVAHDPDGISSWSLETGAITDLFRKYYRCNLINMLTLFQRFLKNDRSIPSTAQTSTFMCCEYFINT